MEDENLDRNRLLYVIKLSGLNGKDFAAKVNVSPSTISQITSTSDKARKTGLTKMVVDKIIDAFPQFNLSYEWLLNGIGPRTVQQQQPSLFDNFGRANVPNGQFTQQQVVGKSVADGTGGVNNVNVSADLGVNGGGVSVNGQNPNLQSVTFQNGANGNPAGEVSQGQSLAQGNAPNPAQGQAQNPAQQPYLRPDTYVPLVDNPVASETAPHDYTPHAEQTATAAPYSDAVPRPQPAVSVERIVIFYSDGTYADYSPRSRR